MLSLASARATAAQDPANETRRPTTASATEDSNSLVSEDNDISNTDDTSYLEHRELTPLLSSDTESVDVFDTASLPGDPVWLEMKWVSTCSLSFHECVR